MNWKVIALATLLAPAALAVPRGSFPGSEYEAAKAKAAETGKPVAVVVTDTASTCPKCQAGNAAVFKEMRSDYVLVIKDKARNDTLPQNIEQRTHEIYRSKGNFIPIVTVLSPDDKVVGGLCYDQISKDSRRAFRDLDKEVADGLSSSSDSPGETTTREDTPEPSAAGSGDGMREWTNVLGHTITAEALAVTALEVTFKMKDGNVVDYPLDRLSDESRKALEEIHPSR